MRMVIPAITNYAGTQGCWLMMGCEHMYVERGYHVQRCMVSFYMCVMQATLKGGQYLTATKTDVTNTCIGGESIL